MPLDLTNATEGKLSLACGAGFFFFKRKLGSTKIAAAILKAMAWWKNLGWRGGRALPLFQFQRPRWHERTFIVSSLDCKNACFLIKCGSESLCPFSLLTEWRAVPFRVLSTREVNQLPELRPTKLSVNHFTGLPNVNLRKISVRKTIWDLEFSEHICCKISCLPASPSIFEHLKNGITAHF